MNRSTSIQRSPSESSRGNDVIGRLAAALGRERSSVEEQIRADRAALARDITRNQSAMRLLRLGEDAETSDVESTLERLAGRLEYAPVDLEKLKKNKEGFFTKLAMAPIRGGRWVIGQVINHPIRTAAAVIGGLIGYKYLRDTIYHRLMSEGHLFGSRAGWFNWFRDVNTTANTLGGEHRNVPIIPRPPLRGPSLPATPGYENVPLSPPSGPLSDSVPG